MDKLMGEMNLSYNKTKNKFYKALKEKKDVDTIKDLLVKGANPNEDFFDKENKTHLNPLIMAIRNQLEIRNQSVDIVQLLLEFGAKPNLLKDNYDYDPLHYACCCIWPNSEAQLKCVQLLVKYGADVNSKDFNGQTPLQMVLPCGHISKNSLPLANFLLENGADINAQDLVGRTLLIEACQQLDFSSVQWLIENGADPLIKDSKGRDAEYYAMYPRVGNRIINKQSEQVVNYIKEQIAKNDPENE